MLVKQFLVGSIYSPVEINIVLVSSRRSAFISAFLEVFKAALVSANV